jgi:enediyne biosynthesis protein E4
MPFLNRIQFVARWFGAISLSSCLPLNATAADWQSGQGYRWQELKVATTGKTYLQRLPASVTGITFTNYLSEDKALESSVRTSGSGVAAGDVDGDGWCDLYFCGMENANALYRNLGNGKFEDITASAGVACADQYSTGAVFADVDGDRDLDLLVNSVGGGSRLFLNDGKGKFTEATNSGLVRKFGSTSFALADIDGNGTLDVYVCNYAAIKIEDRPNARFDSVMVNGRPVLTAIDGVPITSPELTNRYYVDSERIVRELGEADILYLNEGNGKFKPVPWTEGGFLDEDGKPLTKPPYDFGLSVMFRDMNGDLAPDIYVCNDLFPPDRIWVNDGHGKFRAMSNFAVRNTCRFAMGVDFADINRDGYDDFFVVDMLSREHVKRKMQTVGVSPLYLPVGLIDNRPQYKRNTLFLNRGDGTYAEMAQLAGLDATEWSWMPLFLDVDLDGFEDVLVSTGHTRDSLNADAVEAIMRGRRGRKLSDQEHRELKKKHFPLLNLHNQAFRNRGDLTFEDKAHEWGFDYVGTSHGMCLADLDNDGDLDVVVNHLNDLAGIYRNESAAPRVLVRLRGKAPNTHGIGAKIKLLGGPVPQSQEMICGGRYLSGDDTVRMFAAGKATGGMTMDVTWRSGAISRVNDVKPNRLYEIDESGARPSPLAPNTSRATPLFTDASPLIKHTHVDVGFEDFGRQPLLGKRLSQLGPGVSWHDLDGDGWDDLLIGGGAGGQMAAYRNDGKGAFRPWDSPLLREKLQRDQTTLLGWRKADGSNVVLAGTANYEAEQPGGAYVIEFDLAQNKRGGNFPGSEVSVGPMAMADVNGDGTLDLFVGGRVEAQKYPKASSSVMFRGTGNDFVIDEENCKQLALVGMVSGAVFSDLDGDGDPDLVLACEWGPLKIFRNDGGKLTPWNWPVKSSNPVLQTLNQLTGWWNSVTTGDFDGDGRLDIVAGNWGRNSKYEKFRSRRLSVVFGEWTIPGIVDVFEAYEDPEMKKLVPWVTYRLGKLLPWMEERFPTQTAFSTAGIAEVLGDRVKTGKVLEAVWLETTVFLNRGDHFEARPLPIEAQFSPAFGVNVADMDGDGNEDVFLSQNFFAVDGDTSRYDAGRGLLLAGDGRGGFRSVPGQESGVMVYGEQRGSALCDYDGDGRVDLAVSQNGAETKLYRNASARPGLRVRLAGPPGNTAGVGAVLRLASGQRTGPAREIHAGSGYWSQDSAVQVLAAPAARAQLQVRWPGGREVSTDLPAGAKEVTVDSAGKIIRSR